MAGKKQSPLNGLVRGRAGYVVNQKAPVYGDRRTKRNRDRSTRERKATDEQQADE